MKLEFQCWKCGEGTPGRRVTAPFNESSVYRFECAHGHVHEIVLAQLRFEVLAETGMQALVDGYYRDAVASFAAALERVYQLYCEIISRSKGTDPAMFEGTWKLVASQSERQLGMFIGLYFLENGSAPPQLPRKCVELRNKVIHQGLLPTEDDAIAFGQAVVDLVQPVLNAMMPRYTKEIEAFTIQHLEKAETSRSPERYKHRVFFEFILQFDTEADDWDPAPADLRAELAVRRARAAAN
ncbi:hypothetical protein M2337_002404 [Sphingobium sp. B2D3A]|uniref:hypothetical protein n=1 Tax=unclassified Sphingobium TaxID=2611147 RepID=UPI002225ABE5|nr:MULTISPECIES: hypothetical protein [unclassified Sphingobium]MCW2338171.1 hypothetical protein [Sphingobium sp. B2D3A]MCW2384630.1 hypothetical protein [Sphingobium sp. B2D3D]